MVELLTKLERLVIAGLMAAITILTLAQVFWRYILELPLQWSEEIARYCFVWVTFLGAATLMRLQDGHPAIDALYVRVSSKTLGVNLVHFGVVMVVNLAIGTIHPPVGNCLYIVSAISEESIERCSIAVIPVVGVMIAALMLITFAPEIILVVPRYFGY
jgi:TRAP-type C4-dicarboxylate transport system permease large subunit